MDQVKEVSRYHHYAIRADQACCMWIKRYIFSTAGRRFFETVFYNQAIDIPANFENLILLSIYGGKTHPRSLDFKDVENFLYYLAVEQNVSSSTQF